MAFSPWPDKAYVKVFETNETVKMGSYTPSVKEQFSTIQKTQTGGIYIYLFVKGVLAGAERIRTIIYGDSLYSSPLYTSDWSNLSNIPNISDPWHGWMLTLYSSGHLNPNITYYVGAEINAYTRNAYTLYIGLKYDFPNPVYGNALTVLSTQPLALKPFTYKAKL